MRAMHLYLLRFTLAISHYNVNPLVETRTFVEVYRFMRIQQLSWQLRGIYWNSSVLRCRMK